LLVPTTPPEFASSHCFGRVDIVCRRSLFHNLAAAGASRLRVRLHVQSQRDGIERFGFVATTHEWARARGLRLQPLPLLWNCATATAVGAATAGCSKRSSVVHE